MRIAILVGLGVVALAGCAGQNSNQLTGAEAKHALEACGSVPYASRTPAQHLCVKRQAEMVEGRRDCVRTGVAPNQIDRCVTQIIRYADAFRACGGFTGKPERVTACAKRREPEGYRWLMMTRPT